MHHKARKLNDTLQKPETSIKP